MGVGDVLKGILIVAERVWKGRMRCGVAAVECVSGVFVEDHFYCGLI